MDKSIILLEDKEIYGLNKTHKNVLKPVPDILKAKSKIYHDPSEVTDNDQVKVNASILNFVTDGLKFDEQVVKAKAAYALPYNASYVREIYENKNDLGNNFIIDVDKYKFKPTPFILPKQTSNALAIINENSQLAIDDVEANAIPLAKTKFKPKSLFINQKSSKTKKMSKSEKNLLISSEQILNNKETEQERRLSKSLDDLNENQDRVEDNGEGDGTAFFLTQTSVDMDDVLKAKFEKSTIIEENDVPKKKTRPRSAGFKELVNINWDDQLFDSLSENTARWLVMKKITDPTQKQKLVELVDSKFGRYTRDIKYLELIEEALTDFEKEKIAQEKQRIKLLKEQKLAAIESADESTQLEDGKKTPLYRLPHGLKRIQLNKLKALDPKSNKTASEIVIETSRIKSAATYDEKMERKNVTEKTLLKTENPYQAEMINEQSKHVPSKDENIILLENGKSFGKTLQEVYPAEFTAWISGVDLKPSDKPQMKKPSKGKKKWKKLPELIDIDKINKPSEEVETNYWHLLPTTPDAELRKILKSNMTVAKIVSDWCTKWHSSSKWTIAEIDELISDMQNEEANIRFQAVVVCARAAERIQLMIEKMERLNVKKKHSIVSLKQTPKNSLSKDEKSFTELLKAQDEEETFYEKKNLLREAKFNSSSFKMSLKSSHSSFNCANEPRDVTSNYSQYYDLFFSDKLFQSIESVIETETNGKVKLAASITMFTILRKFSRPLLKKFQIGKNKAEDVLLNSLKSFNANDKFAAAKCLAIDLICNRDIVDVLLFNYFNTDENVTREQCVRMLTNLSVLNSMVGEMIEVFLKSEHVNERILSCKLFPYLGIKINQNVTDRLIYLMWNDINPSVKKVAAQTLGRTGKGKFVYEEVYTHLCSPNVIDKLEALKIINHIGIMTPKLLRVYLRCFRDDYISVRELACKSAQFLNEKDESVISSLVFMAKFDKVNKLKALAIRTIGLIGDFNLDIRNCLIWALQFEIDPFIRTEACHCILLLIDNLKDQDLLDVLLERYLIEEEALVKKEIKYVLEYLGFNSTIELPMVTRIKEQIKKFNDKNEIIDKIKKLERELSFEMNKERFIWNPKDDEKDESDEEHKSARRTSISFRKHSITNSNLRKKSLTSLTTTPHQSAMPLPTTPTFLPTQISGNNLSDTMEKIENFLQIVNKKYLDELKQAERANRKSSKQASANANAKSKKHESSNFLSKLVDKDDNEESATKKSQTKQSKSKGNSRKSNNISRSSSQSIQVILEETTDLALT